MRAGLLRELLEFQDLTISKSPTGATSKVYTPAFKVRGCKQKLSLIADTAGVNASEQFLGNTLVFQIRYNPSIDEDQQVIYQGTRYAIQLLNRRPDNSYLITLKKIND